VPIITPVRSEVEIETAIIALGREPGGGLVIMLDVFMIAHRSPIISAAARNNVPVVYGFSYFARDGGLLSYGFDPVDIFRRAAEADVRPFDVGKRSCAPPGGVSVYHHAAD
jgi:putative ABC transport system substrate-binding protein